MEYKVRDLLTIRNGKDHKQLGDGKYPVYGSGGIMRYVDSYLYDKPSILLPRKGTLDNIQYCDTPFWCVDTTYYTEVNTSLANPYYLYRYLSILNLKGLDSGTALPSMTFDSYYQIKVSLPPIEIQNSIGNLLYEIDQKIALNTRMNVELEAMAKQLYDYWFVQFDFPDENGKPYKSSGGKMVYNPILKRDIPTGWEVKEISDFAEIKSGYPFKSENMNEYKGKYKIVTIRNVQENNLDLSNISYTDIIPDNIKSYCILKEKDILISLTGNVGRTCLVYENGLLLNQRVGLVQPKNSNVPWCYSIFKDKSIRTAVENWANGCAQANVSPLDIERLKIPVPSNDILQYFDKSVKPMIERQIKIAKQNNYLTHLRDSLLPMLMNGQVTVE